MKKTLVVNMSNVYIEGDILDLSYEESGVIYGIYKDIEDELSIDYVDERSKYQLKGRKYDACTFFFNFNEIGSRYKKENIIKEAYKYLKLKGKIYLWDVNKRRGKTLERKVEILLPNGKVKESSLKNKNILIKSIYEDTLKVVEKYYNIEETKVWEEMYFIKGEKR